MNHKEVALAAGDLYHADDPGDLLILRLDEDF